MTAFWIIAALLLAGALVMMLPGLWAASRPAVSVRGTNVALHRDQLEELERDAAGGLIDASQLAVARAEVQRRLLEDAEPASPDNTSAPPARALALLLAVIVPVGSIATYLALGRPDAVAPAAAAAPTADARHNLTEAQIIGRVTALAERLRAEPGNAEGWVMLGRSYTMLGRYRDATLALRRAVDIVPRNPSLLADLADVTAMAQGKRLAGEPARLVQQALDVDPRHPKALSLAGSIAFEARDYAAARGYWERLAAVVPPESDMARSVRGSIAEALRLEGAAPALAAAQAPGADAGAAKVSGRVSVSPSVVDRLRSGSTLFVYARAAQGPRMPLAVLRVPAGAQTTEFVLDDAMAMAPNLKLSGFPQVVVAARISASGSATPQSGDLVAQGITVAPGASGLSLVIDSVQP